jgi:hypothetical protein
MLVDTLIACGVDRASAGRDTGINGVMKAIRRR